MSTEHIPQDPRNLIVNYIPTPVDDEELRQLFEQFGELESARVIIDRVSGVPKGYGFVKYKDENAAREAIQKMNGFEIKNKRLKVTTAKGPNATQMERQAHAQQQQSSRLSQGPPPPPPMAPPPPPQQQITVDPNTGMAMIQVPIHQLPGLIQFQQQMQPQVLLAPMQVPGGYVAQQGLTQYVPVIQTTGGVMQQAYVTAQQAGLQQPDGANRR